MNATSLPPGRGSDARWRFWRDVLVFQVKLFLDNVRDFALVPISLAAALIDLVYKGEREGALFYRVLRWGAHSEEVINVYSAIDPPSRSATAGPGDLIEQPQEDGLRVNPKYTVDAVVARIEEVVVREVEKGGTAASIKSALDRAIDQLHSETREKSDLARGAMARAADKLRLKIDTLPPEKEEG